MDHFNTIDKVKYGIAVVYASVAISVKNEVKINESDVGALKIIPCTIFCNIIEWTFFGLSQTQNFYDCKTSGDHLWHCLTAHRYFLSGLFGLSKTQNLYDSKIPDDHLWHCLTGHM